MDPDSKVMKEVIELKKDVTCFIDETRDLENRGCQANLRLTGGFQGREGRKHLAGLGEFKGKQWNPRESLPWNVMSPLGPLMASLLKIYLACPWPSPLCRTFPSLNLFSTQKPKRLGHFEHRRTTEIKGSNGLAGSLSPSRLGSGN